MFGIWLVIISTLIVTFGDAGKKKLTAILDPLYVVWLMQISIVSMGGIYFISAGFPTIQSTDFAKILAMAVCFNIVAEISFIKGIEAADFSLAIPLMAFSPVVVMILGWFTFGEVPQPFALVGIFLLIFGAYTLYLPEATPGQLFAPLKLLATHTAARCMGLLSLAFGFMAMLQKMGAEISSPLFFTWCNAVGALTFFSVLMVARGKFNFQPIREHKKLVLLTAITWVTGYVGVFVSFSYTLAVYVAALNRLNALFSIPVGWLIFKEQKAIKRALPAMVMLAGAILVVIAGAM